MPNVNDFITAQARQAFNSNSPTTLMGARSLLRFNRLPRWMVFALIIAVVGSWVPLAWVVRERFVRGDLPPLHLIQDMDKQPKFGPQGRSALFANNMAMRPEIPGTVPRGKLQEDDHFYRGYRLERGEGGELVPVFFDGFPGQVQITPAFVARGKELWARNCYMCHGYDGYGNGPIHQRASRTAGQNPAWIPPSSLHDQVRAGRNEGHLYNTINQGIRSMAGYGHMIAPEDRWAIVAYVRAMQLSQNAPAALVPAGLREQIPVSGASIGGRNLLAAQAVPSQSTHVLPGTPEAPQEESPDVQMDNGG